jgi:hypothetical protein
VKKEPRSESADMNVQCTNLAAAVWEARRLLTAWAESGDDDPETFRADLYEVLDTPEVREALEQLSDESIER